MSLRDFAITATVLLTGALATGAAHAGPNVHWQVTVETPTIRLPGRVVIPLPPILVPRAVVVAPQHDDRGYREPRRWDDDGDGVPNRYDRSYSPRWDRDGDGIPNRHDAYPNDPRNGRHWRDRDDWQSDQRHHDRRDGRDDRRDWRGDRHGR
jgi:hypothetical protein